MLGPAELDLMFSTEGLTVFLTLAALVSSNCYCRCLITLSLSASYIASFLRISLLSLASNGMGVV